jgi:hypothetical protein
MKENIIPAEVQAMTHFQATPLQVARVLEDCFLRHHKVGLPLPQTEPILRHFKVQKDESTSI